MGTTNLDSLELGGDLEVTGAVSAGATTVSSVSVTGTISVGAALDSTTDTVTGSGAASVATLITKLNTTGGGAITLADGTDGQVKILVLDVDSGTDAVITPATATGFTTITLDDVGDGATLIFATTRGWMCVGSNGATLA